MWVSIYIHTTCTCMNKTTLHLLPHAVVPKSRVMHSRPSLCIKLRQRVWGEWEIFHATETCSPALYRCCPFHPLYQASNQMDWIKIYCHHRSICSASPTLSVSWPLEEESTSVIGWASISSFAKRTICNSVCYLEMLLFLYYCSLTQPIYEQWCRPE